MRKVRKFIRDRGGKAGINIQKEMGEEDYDIRKQRGRDRERKKKSKGFFNFRRNARRNALKASFGLRVMTLVRTEITRNKYNQTYQETVIV